MFREMKSLDTPLAREVQAIMAAGTLVPDVKESPGSEERKKKCAKGNATRMASVINSNPWRVAAFIFWRARNAPASSRTNKTP